VAELGRALAHHASTFASYLLSFGMLGMLWYHNNQHYRYLERITGGMLALHFVQLSMAAFFPFCAALMGRYPVNPLTLVVYIGCIMVYMWAAMMQWLLAKKSGAFGRDVTQALYRRYRKRNAVSSIMISSFFIMYLFLALKQ
jgi:uncharacterized membrane protein